jgi:hypothetical protein
MEMIKSREDCLTADEATEMETLRMDGMTIEELPQRLEQFRQEEADRVEPKELDWLNLEDEDL